MPSLAPVFELWNYCPYLACGERTGEDSTARFCGRCGSVFNLCPACRATNRLLALFCRGCGRKMEFESWPLHVGLREQQVKHKTIRAIKDVRAPFPICLDTSVSLSPLTVDGLVILTTDDGSILLLSELNGERIGQLSVSDKAAVTPALSAGTLFVAAGRNLHAFDLAAFLDQGAQGEASPAWSVEAAGGVVTQPVLVDERAAYMVAQSGETSTVEAFSQVDGIKLWPAPVTLSSNKTAPPVLIGKHLVLVTLNGEVSIVDPLTGAIEQTFPLNRKLDAQVSPFVVGERVVMADIAGSIFEIVVSETSGTLINQLHDHRSRVSGLAASAEYIALSHLGGLTFLTSRGHLLWSYDMIESLSVAPILAGESIFALDDAGNGLLFDVLKSNPVTKVKLFSGEVGSAPVMTQTSIIAASRDGQLAIVAWH